jgi:Outer membrane protein beta-barrel domain
MKKATVLAILVISAQALFAQLHVGVRSGVQLSTIQQSNVLSDLTPKADYNIGNSTAAFAELDLGESFSLQAELGYSARGFRYALQENIDINGFKIPLGGRADFRFNNLELPVLFKAKSGQGDVRFYAQVGPYLGYTMNSTLTGRTTGLVDLKIFETDLDLDLLNYNRLDFGAVGGLGMEVNTSFGRFFLDGRYQHGFTPNADIPVVRETFRSRGFAANLGFAVAL